jgi:hypothetical protein
MGPKLYQEGYQPELVRHRGRGQHFIPALGDGFYLSRQKAIHVHSESKSDFLLRFTQRQRGERM